MAFLPSKPDATLIDAFKAVPDIARPLHRLAEAVMRGPSPFTAVQREMIAVRVSQANACAFCRDSHASTLRHLGVDDETLRSVIEDTPPKVDPAMAAALTYADKLNTWPQDIEKADVDAVLAAGWSEEALHHLNLVVGFFSMMNRWVDGLGIESDPKTVEMAGRKLARQGYTAVESMPQGAKAD